MATAEIKTRESWLAERQSGIGASESACALGLSPYKSPLRLWAEKTGQIEPDDLSDKLAVRLGTEMEQAVGRIFQEESRRQVNFWPQHTVARHKDAPFMLCTPDAIETFNNRDGVLQIKTAGRSQEHLWSPRGPGLLRVAADAPPEYQVQLAHEMEVLGFEWGTLACAIDRQFIAYFDLERNERFAQVLMAKLADFWEMVLTKTPPEADWTESTREAILKLHPNDDGSSVDLPDEAATWDAELREAKEKAKELDRYIAERENRIRLAIGPATFGVLPNGQRYSFKHQHRKGYTVAESDIRVLLRLKK
jgi:putative phage-type endonuclease